MKNIEKFNKRLAEKLAKQLKNKKRVFVNFEDYAGCYMDFEKALKDAGLDWTEKCGGNYTVVNK